VGLAENAGFETYRGTRIFGALDGLRCLSILAVVWHHTRTGSVAWLPATANGFLGVDLFFVISGFLIPTLILRERDRTGELSLRGFYARRSLRIFPPYYGLLLAFTLVLATVGRDARMAAPFFAELPFYLTYTSNWIETSTMLGISWSLAAEEQFYLVWPPIERFARRLALPILGVFIVVNQLVTFRLVDGVLERLGLHFDDLQMLQATFTPILLGVAVAHALHAPASYARVRRALGHPIAPVVLLVLLFALCNIPGSLTGWPRLSIQLTMAALVAACVVREDHALMPLLRLRPIVYVGTISYGMYLYHLIALHPVDLLLRRAGLEVPGLRFLACALLTIAIAGLSYRFFERPFLRLKERFAH